jgi:hypothetical protein
MNYFVSIDDSYQHSWQIELLIQSFKDKGVDDNLHVAIGVDDSNTVYDCKNLSNHKNKFFFKKSNSNLSFNKWYSLLTIMKEKEIFPLTILNPYNIFCSDISFNKQKIIASEDPFFTQKVIKNHVSLNNVEDNWIKFGNTIFLNNLPLSFFEDMVSYTMYLLNKKDFFGIDRAALILSIWKNYETLFTPNEEASDIEIRPYSIESNMLSNVVKNIINYEHGIQPSFNKIWFSKSDFIMHPESPIVCLSKIRHTRCSDFIADVAQNYLNEL